MESPAFSNFRSLLDCWDEAVDQMTKDQIKAILDGGDLVLFFKKDNDLFAAPESARVVFATMKHPDEEMPKTWAKEANFAALDLSKALEGLMVKRVFGYKDLKKIKVMEQDEMYKQLVKLADKHQSKVNLAKAIKDMPKDNDDEPEPDNMFGLGEK